MKIKIIFLALLSMFSISCQSQTKQIENRTIDFYFEQIAGLEMEEMLKQKVLIDSVTIAKKYRDTISNSGLNTEGFQKYADIKMNIYLDFFKEYLYLQSVVYNDEIFGLYFSMAGFDDIQFDIISISKDSWDRKERLSREAIENDKTVKHILFNYDEGEKNLENIRIFIQNDYLIMERGNLYHSLYDLKNKKVIVNEESPWHEAQGDGKEGLNSWIKANLHDKIELIISE